MYGGDGPIESATVRQHLHRRQPGQRGRRPVVNRLYAAAAEAGLQISEDGGDTWALSTIGMPAEASVFDVATDPNHPDTVYAAAINAGAFVSTDRGETWQPLNDGLTTRSSVRLALSGDGSVLVVGTDGGGVARLAAD